MQTAQHRRCFLFARPYVPMGCSPTLFGDNSLCHSPSFAIGARSARWLERRERALRLVSTCGDRIDLLLRTKPSEEQMTSVTQNFDAIVIGAGFSGLHMLKSLRDKLGMNVRVYEEGDTVGGTWYWNRYPGARCDSDAYIYCFTWDRQLLQEWEWSERYPEQPEILRYLEHVAKRHDLKRNIQFNTPMTSAEFDETTNL